MNNQGLSQTIALISVCGLCACIGLASAAGAQQGQMGTPANPGNQNNQPGQQNPTSGAGSTGDRQNQGGQTQDRPYNAQMSEYMNYSRMSSADIVDGNDKHLGEIRDLLIDRGSGRIEFAVVSFDRSLGLNERTVAVPFSGMRWDSTGKRFTMQNASVDQLRQYPAWDSRSWRGTMSRGRNTPSRNNDRDSSMSAFDKYYAEHSGQSGTDSDMFSKLDMGSTQKVVGEIKSIDRVNADSYGEQMVATISTASGDKTVFFGPSWYINGAHMVPKRGDRVSVDAVPATSGNSGGVGSPVTPGNRNTNSRSSGELVATSVQLTNAQSSGKKEDYRLRTREGASWAGNQFESDGYSYGRSYYRLALASKIASSKLDCRGAGCGEVDDLILDTYNGRVAFLSVDPDQNFLGIGDTKRLAPWGIASVGLDNSVRLDTDKAMLTQSPATPSDVTTLRNTGLSDSVYRAYNVGGPETYRSWSNGVMSPSTRSTSPNNNNGNDNNNNPRDPNNPNRPGTPGSPTTPGNPGGPSTPGSPTTPGSPGGPSTPGSPTTPGSPGGPSTPGSPSSPNLPGGGGGTGGGGSGTNPR